jgi:hypothetical protein
LIFVDEEYGILSNNLFALLHDFVAREPVSVVFSISFKSRARSNDVKSAVKDSTNKNIPSIEVYM